MRRPINLQMYHVKVDVFIVCPQVKVILLWPSSGGKYEEIHHPLFESWFEWRAVIVFLIPLSFRLTSVPLFLRHTRSTDVTDTFSCLDSLLWEGFHVLNCRLCATTVAFVGYLILQQSKRRAVRGVAKWEAVTTGPFGSKRSRDITWNDIYL